MNLNTLKHGHKAEDTVTEDRIAAFCQLVIQSFHFLIYDKEIRSPGAGVVNSMNYRSFLYCLLTGIVRTKEYFFQLQQVNLTNGNTEIQILGCLESVLIEQFDDC